MNERMITTYFKEQIEGGATDQFFYGTENNSFRDAKEHEVELMHHYAKRHGFPEPWHLPRRDSVAEFRKKFGKPYGP